MISLHKSVIFLLLPVLFLVAGCPKRAQIARPTDAAAALADAIGFLDAEQYRQAEESFTFIVFNFPGSRQASDAQFYLGETFFRNRGYTEAQTEYDFYLRSFPNGRFQERASFQLALSHLRMAPSGSRDQSSTIKARGLLNEFLMLYPESELTSEAEDALSEIERQLTSRDFDIARLYYKPGEYKSALVYYEYIASELEPAKWDPLDRFQLGVCYQETDRPEQARTVFTELLAGDCPESLKQQVSVRLDRLD